MNKLFRDSTYSLVSSITNLVVALGSSILIARLLGPEGKGIITLVSQIAGLGSTIFTFGLSLSYQYFLGKNIISLQEVNGHLLVQTIITIVLIIILMLVGGENFLQEITQGALSHDLLKMAIALLILNTFLAYINGPLMALRDGVKLSSLYSISSTIIYGFGVLLFTWILGWGIAGILLATLLGICIRIMFSWKKIYLEAFKKIKFAWLKHSKPLFVYGLSTMIGQIMMAGVLRIDTFLVNMYLGSGALGIYSIAFTFAEFIFLIPRSFGVAIFPQMNIATKKDQIQLMASTARINLILVLFGAFFLILVGFPMIKLLYGARFESAFMSLLWILPGVIAMALTYSSYHFFFSSTGRPYILAVTYGLGIAINIASNIILIPVMGINGASLSSSITYLVITLVFILTISIEEKLPLRKLFIPKKEDFWVIYSAFKKLLSRIKELIKIFLHLSSTIIN